MSNPVRQPLYNFTDVGAKKAEIAAKRLTDIFPSIKAIGHDIPIPMPGHSISPAERDAVRESVGAIEGLVKSHDALFLLTDSRESRWFPTLLGAFHDKIVINIALGFDSFLVMRHGSTTSSLGCYFCKF